MTQASTARSCERCGNFAPLKRVWSNEVCEPCSARVAPVGVFDKLAALLRQALPLVPAVGLVCMAGRLLLAAPFEVAAAIYADNSVVAYLMQALFGVGAICAEAISSLVIVDYLQTGQRRVGPALLAVGRRLGTMLGIALLFNLGFFIAVVLLFAPAFWFVMAFAIPVQAAVFEGLGPWQAMGRSRRLMVGMKLPAAFVVIPLIALDLVLGLAFKATLPWLSPLVAVVLAIPSHILSTVLYLEQRAWQER